MIVIYLVIGSCKLNQYKDELRQGRWVFKDSTTTGVFISKGRFKKGEEVATWKFYENKILYKTEKYKDNIIIVKIYYPDGKLKVKGFNKQERTAQGLHWYYTGTWKYYSIDGKLDSSKFFYKGEEVERIPSENQ